MIKENDILNKNLKIIEESYPEIYADYLEYADKLQDDTETFLDKSLDGCYITGVVHENRDWYFNSRYNPVKAAEEWSEKFSNINFQAIFVVLGLANGMYAKTLLNKLQETNSVLIYEPSKILFYRVIQEIDISEILSDERVFIGLQGVNDRHVLEFMIFKIDYTNMFYLEYCALPNYDKLYQTEWRDIMQTIKNQVEKIVINRNTQILFKHEFIVNMFMNYRDMVKQHTVNQIKKKFEDVDYEKTPVIIVSAGPSLDKNIRELKAAKGKAFIICVDTALNSMLKEGIMPDIAVTVDPHKPILLFQKMIGNNIPIVVSQFSNKDIILTLDSKRFYIGEEDYIANIYKQYDKESPVELESGGSVAHIAFSLSYYLGFKTIILVGQDLAYTGNKKHTTDAYDLDNTFIKEMDESDDYELVDAIDGGKVWTKGNMKAYINWFEEQILRYPELKVIDATEGGALKKGTIVMTLKEAIDSECKGDCDFRGKLNEIETAFSTEEQNKIFATFKNLKEDIVAEQKKMQEGVRYYEKMYDLYRKGKSGTKEYEKVLKDIGEINYHAEHNPIITLSAQYNAAENYEVQEQVYKVKADEKEEMKSIRDLGVKMLKSYHRALEKMKDDVKYLDGEAVMQVFFEKIRAILNYIDYTSYYYRGQRYYEGNLDYKGTANSLSSFFNLYNNHEDVLKKRGINVNQSELLSSISAVVGAQQIKDYVLMVDLLQYQLKPLFQDLMFTIISTNNYTLKNFQEENMEACRIHNPQLYQLVNEDMVIENGYETEITAHGTVTLKRKLRVSEFYFHSNQNPFLEAAIQSDGMQIKMGEQVVLLGLGFGILPYTLMRQKFENQIYIYEHDKNIIKLAFQTYKLTMILKSKNVHIIYDPDLTRFSRKIVENNVNVFFHKPSVMNIQNRRLKEVIEEIQINYESAKNQSAMLQMNLKENLANISNTLDDEKEILRGKTVIYIAGGQSLDNDIAELRKKAIQDDMILVAAGTVYKKLLKEKIVPEYVIITDAKASIKSQIDGTECTKTKLLYLSTVNKIVTDAWNGEKYIVFQEGMEAAEKYAKQNSYTLISTGGSVSTAAIDIGIRMKAARVVCVGLDLAFIGESDHASGTNEKKLIDIENMRKVKGVDGREIPTRTNLDTYRHWIERRIADVKDVELINCSGGAYINGMKHMKLSELT
ncbi:MAG: motility associated factor glycosyltransferase family protein [Lachnospiraceae bacterium]|nr:motility associated factor glycosyltransferase family protein [Lachnospiraceae bacterium]